MLSAFKSSHKGYRRIIGFKIASEFYLILRRPAEQYRKLKESIAGVPYRETDVGGIGNDRGDARAL